MRRRVGGRDKKYRGGCGAGTRTVAGEVERGVE